MTPSRETLSREAALIQDQMHVLGAQYDELGNYLEYVQQLIHRMVADEYQQTKAAKNIAKLSDHMARIGRLEQAMDRILKGEMPSEDRLGYERVAEAQDYIKGGR